MYQLTGDLAGVSQGSFDDIEQAAAYVKEKLTHKEGIERRRW